MATCGSLDTFFCFILPSAVFIRIDFPSKSIHVGVICGEPSFIRVATNAKVFPVSSCITKSSISQLTCMFSSLYQVIKVRRFMTKQKLVRGLLKNADGITIGQDIGPGKVLLKLAFVSASILS